MENIRNQSIIEHCKRAYLDYAMSVVRGRAIPSIDDGLKPVHRRILFAMRDLSLDHAAKPKKSARVVGDVIGKYHPHGDSSVYEAMVIMAQPFKMRYPLVDGHGNFGYLDDPKSFAAMRYTECRLTPIAETILDELKWDTVDMVSNYDGTLQEPVVMPSRLPMSLLNATMGVAVGMSTRFIPHQLNELVEAAKLVLNKGNVTVDEIMEKMPGPDFPTGATIISSPEEIKKVYEEGKGPIRVRAKWHVEDLPRKKWVLHVTELPPEVSPSKLMEKIGELLNPVAKVSKKDKEKGGKSSGGKLSDGQLKTKRLFTESIDDFKDLSEKGKVDIAFWPKDHSQSPEEFFKLLCASTDLEINVPAQLLAVNSSGTPKVAGVIECLQDWAKFRIETVSRRTRHQREKLMARLHIVEGRLKILDCLDEAIKIIRHSDDAKSELMQRFDLSEIQAEDVLDMRLRQLQKLESGKLKDEEKKLNEEISRLTKILDDEKLMKREIIKELDSDAKRFGDVRRSDLVPDKSTNSKQVILEKSVKTLGPEPIGVVLTDRNWIAWRPVKTLEEALSADYKIKNGDSVKKVFFGDRSEYLALLNETGRGYSIRLTDLPSKADTLPLSTWFDSDHNFAEGTITAEGNHYVLAGQGGCGFVVKSGDWLSRKRAGKEFLELEAGELPITPVLVGPEVNKEDLLTVVTEDGRAVVFKLGELGSRAKGKGMVLMDVAGSKVSDIALVKQDEFLLIKTPKGEIKVTKEAIAELTSKRSASKKGKPIHKNTPISAKFVRAGREVYASVVE